MQKFLHVQSEQQEQERKRRIELDKILQNFKQEEGRTDTPLLGKLFPDLNALHQRQRRRSEENPISYRTSIHPPGMETDSIMGSLQPFRSLIPPILQTLPQLSSLPELHTTSGATSLPPTPVIAPPSVRSRTSEQMSAINDLSNRFQGEKLVPDRREQGSRSVTSETVQSRTVKNKIKDYLNQLAGSKEYKDLDFPGILRQLTIQAQQEEEEF